MKTRNDTSVNAGSMADIAFLLLIFFLVTTTINVDEGINQKLPPECIKCPIGEKYERNILRVMLNRENQLLVNGTAVSLQTLKSITKDFLDNNGDSSCDYCKGKANKDSSDNPQLAVVSLQNDRQTEYKFYISVLNEISMAYSELRNEYAITTYNKPLLLLDKTATKEVQQRYPRLISEAETS
jgi:biopolymer transport protein ExbD